MKGQFKLCINETAVDYNGPEKVEIMISWALSLWMN